jgi:hypothetical protein
MTPEPTRRFVVPALQDGIQRPRQEPLRLPPPDQEARQRILAHMAQLGLALR